MALFYRYPYRASDWLLLEGAILKFRRSLSQYCWAQHVARVWLPCCDVLRHVGCCLKISK